MPAAAHAHAAAHPHAASATHSHATSATHASAAHAHLATPASAHAHHASAHHAIYRRKGRSNLLMRAGHDTAKLSVGHIRPQEKEHDDGQAEDVTCLHKTCR